MKRIIGIFIVIFAMTAILAGCGKHISDKGKKYLFHVVDSEGNGISNVGLQICDDSLCRLETTDETGTVEFDGEPAVYEIHVLKYPEEFYYDSEKVYTTADTYEEVTFVLEDAK